MIRVQYLYKNDIVIVLVWCINFGGGKGELIISMLSEDLQLLEAVTVTEYISPTTVIYL